MDNERLIGDANKRSLSRDRNGVPEGDAGISDFISARGSGLSGGGVGGAAIVCSIFAWCWVGRFEENRQFSVLASFYRYRLLASRFAF